MTTIPTEDGAPIYYRPFRRWRRGRAPSRPALCGASCQEFADHRDPAGLMRNARNPVDLPIETFDVSRDDIAKSRDHGLEPVVDLTYDPRQTSTRDHSMIRAAPLTREAISFGAFRLFPTERLLEKDGSPVHLGSRALDILGLLVERAGEVVSKDELIARAWPKLTVDETNLRFQIASLRKSLGDGKIGPQYVKNIAGRGYCFVAPITKVERTPAVSSNELLHSDVSLPQPSRRMVGREQAVRMIASHLSTHRFITIHGPGGIGKTTVASAIGSVLSGAFEGAVHFIDLGTLSDPRLVPGAVSAALGLMTQSSDPTSSLIRFLGDRRMLLILDNCEHVIEAAAVLAEQIFQEAREVNLIATSREPLRVEGEHVYRLPPLDYPPDGALITAADLLTYSAASLFVERAAAGGHEFALTDEKAPVLAEICRKLDGIALSIELAAGQVGMLALPDIAALLDDRLRLLWRGRRTALPRHRTLIATLDWSHGLLTEVECTVFRRLSVFASSFTLEAAQRVAAGADLDRTHVLDVMGQLVAKSLVSGSVGGQGTRYRLIDATRAYAAGKLAGSGEADQIAYCHALYYSDLLDRGLNDGYRADHLANVQAALKWCFAGDRDIALGTALAAASATLFLEMSRLGECRHWAERALSSPDQSARGPRREMELQAALGHSLMYTESNSEDAHAALVRGLELADALNDRLSQFKLLSRLHMYYRRTGAFGRLLAIAQRAEVVARDIGDPVGVASAQSLLGLSHHLLGNQGSARPHSEAALALPAASISVSTTRFGFHPDRARAVLARTLWLEGFPDRAVLLATQMINEPAAPQDPVNRCIVLIFGLSVFQWAGDLASAERYVEDVAAHASRHSLAPFITVADCLRGEMLIKRGDADRGIELLRSLLSSLHVERYELYTTAFNATLVEALAMTGHLKLSLMTVDDVIRQARSNGDLFYMPELMRIRGDILARMADERGAEEHFQHAIELADGQSALSWRLRAVISFARLRMQQGCWQEARKLVAETYHRFTEGFHTADLMAAKLLLQAKAR
jgi:predicted ATPase/DNA-binding winged helix-turn-helix (wHTH) protein